MSLITKKQLNLVLQSIRNILETWQEASEEDIKALFSGSVQSLYDEITKNVTLLSNTISVNEVNENITLFGHIEAICDDNGNVTIK